MRAKMFTEINMTMINGFSYTILNTNSTSRSNEYLFE